MSDAAVTVIFAGLIQLVGMIIGFLTMWLRLKYGIEEKAKEAANKADKAAEIAHNLGEKVDSNTKITIAVGEAAVSNASYAHAAAEEAKTATENIDRKLNGGIDSSIAKAIEPLKQMLEEHSKTFVTETKFKDFMEYVRKRNHDMLDAMGVTSNKVETLLVMMRQKEQEKTE